MYFLDTQVIMETLLQWIQENPYEGIGNIPGFC